MTSIDKSFRGEVRVASSIVDFLSSGLYASPAACLKELINNSYDADARVVKVFVKPEADRIIVDDDGHGFTRDEFTRHFDRVSESTKRDVTDRTARGRPKIGLIGIGFVAANEICEEMEILSTVKGSQDLLHVVVDFREMRKSRSERRREGEDVAKGDYYGSVKAAPKGAHYTRIFLNNVRGDAREMLAGAQSARGVAGDGRSLYGLSPQSVARRLIAPAIRSWTDFDFYSQTMLAVGLNVPVSYVDGWIPASHGKLVMPFLRRTEDLGFQVIYDGTDLRKPVVLSPGDRGHVAEGFSFRGDHVSADGYLYARHGTLHPTELNGVLFRIRHAAVGEHDPTFMDYPKSRGTLFQRWISAEVWADDRLERAMNIDRRTLRESHEAYAELQRAFHQRLSDFIRRVRTDLHGKPAAARRESKARDEAASIVAVVSRASENLGKEARSTITTAWEDSSEPADVRSLLKKYTVSEVYDVVIDVAQAVLSPKELDRFVQELTRRLRG